MGFKMMGKSPMIKKLIGKQGNLPEGLKQEILASPAKKKGSHKMPDGTMMEDSAMKKHVKGHGIKPRPTPPVPPTPRPPRRKPPRAIDYGPRPPRAGKKEDSKKDSKKASMERYYSKNNQDNVDEVDTSLKKQKKSPNKKYKNA